MINVKLNDLACQAIESLAQDATDCLASEEYDDAAKAVASLIVIRDCPHDSTKLLDELLRTHFGDCFDEELANAG